MSKGWFSKLKNSLKKSSIDISQNLYNFYSYRKNEEKMVLYDEILTCLILE